jgi:hypothetical protein
MSLSDLPPDTKTLVKRREQYSGKGKSFSQWFDITSDPAPAGYTLQSAEFHLEGDRRCGAWAECREISNDGHQVTWQFRMQGHEEGPKDAISVGVLTTIYFRPSPQDETYTTVVRSPLLYSGSKGSFGCFAKVQPAGAKAEWCEISAPTPHPGYQILHVLFRLTGDRQIEGDDLHKNVQGNYASCRERERTAQSSIWQFQMQGHSESTKPITAGKSQAELTVTYKRIPSKKL